MGLFKSISDSSLFLAKGKGSQASAVEAKAKAHPLSFGACPTYSFWDKLKLFLFLFLLRLLL